MIKKNQDQSTGQNKAKNQVSEFIETRFGSRALSTMNHSKVMALPKVALSNMCGDSEPKRLDVTLVQKGQEKWLKISPLCKVKKEGDSDE